MNTNSDTGNADRQPRSWRRILAALGAAVAIGIGGVGMIGQEEAQAAGVDQPLVVQTNPITVQPAQTTTEGRD